MEQKKWRVLAEDRRVWDMVGASVRLKTKCIAVIIAYTNKKHKMLLILKLTNTTKNFNKKQTKIKFEQN